MSYTPKPTMKSTLPHEGFFFLKEPVECSDGVFQAGSIVRMSAIRFNEDKITHTAEYKIYGLNKSEIITEVISDKYYFCESNKWSEKWNEKFVPLNGIHSSAIALDYYDKIAKLRSKDANINRKIDTLDKAKTIIIPIAGLFLIIALITASAETLVAAIASAGVIAVLVVLEKCFKCRRENIAKSMKQYEFNAFFAFENACCT